MVTVALELEIRTAYSVPMSAMLALFASVPGAAWCSLDLSLPGAGCAAALGFARCQDPQRIPLPGVVLDFLWRRPLLLLLHSSTSPPLPSKLVTGEQAVFGWLYGQYRFPSLRLSLGTC